MTDDAVAARLAANPFPGLRSFEPAEADRFFGRQAQIDALVARLAHTTLLAVSGASGCGKSSLVKAGLLHALQRLHQDEGQTAWLPVVMRPGQQPIAHLARALAAVLPGRVDAAPGAAPDGEGVEDLRAESIQGQLRLGGLGLVEVVRWARLTADTRVLVVVDQFEELFRLRRAATPGGVDAVADATPARSETDEASAFVKLLLQAAADPGAAIHVILTLRSDTLGGCAAFDGLPEAVSAGSVLVPRLSRSQRKQAITGPVHWRGQAIAPRLVQRLLNDVSDDFDDLPVMQHALSRTWQHWARQADAGSAAAPPGGLRPLDLEDYLAVGGASAALARHADEARSSLGPLGEPGGMVERVFRALTERTADGMALRRPLPWLQLCAVCAGDDDAAAIRAVQQVVDRYRRSDTAFLLPGTEVPLASNPVIDISHESLIRQWPLLRRWVVAESEAVADLQRLAHDAQAHAEADGELWRGRNLERARDWQQRNRPTAAWVQLGLSGLSGLSGATPSGAAAPGSGAALLASVQGFLDKSSAAQQHEQRRTRLYRWGLASLGAGVVVVSLAAAFNAWTLQRKARSGELAAQAILQLNQDPTRSAHLALASLDLNADNDRAQYALRQAMATLEVASALHVARFDAPITVARYTADQRRLVVAGNSTVWRLDADTLAVQDRLPARGPVIQAWELNAQALLVHSHAGVHLQAPDGSLRADLSCPGGKAAGGLSQFAPAQAGAPAQVAVACADGSLRLWTLTEAGPAQADELAPAQADPVAHTALGFSADGQWLASGEADGRVLVWRRGADKRPWIGALRPGLSPLKHDAAVRDVSFSRTNAALLATASDDRSARVWTLDLGARQVVDLPNMELRLRHDRSVSVARFVDAQASASDVGPLMTVSGKRVMFWSDDKTHDERTHDDWVSDASVSDNGEFLVSASDDGTARVWSSRTAVPVAVLRGHRNEVTQARFGPGNRLVTASRDHSVRLWALQAPRLLASGTAWQLSAALDGSGRQWVLCGEKDSQRINCRLQAAAAGPTAASAPGMALAEIKSAEMVSDASVSADGSLLLAQRASADLISQRQAVLWRLADRSLVKLPWLAALDAAVFNAARPEWLALAPDGKLQIWPQAALALDAPPAPLWQAPAQAGRKLPALSPDGRWVAAALGAQVQVWDRQAPAAAPRLLNGHQGELRSLAFSRDSQALVSASADRTARIWPMGRAAAGGAAGERVLKGGHSAALSSAAFSPDGAWVVTASADNTVRVWDAKTGLEGAALYRHSGAVNQALFDASGEQILSVSDDGTALLGRCDACRLPLDALRQMGQKRVRQVLGDLPQ